MHCLGFSVKVLCIKMKKIDVCGVFILSLIYEFFLEKLFCEDNC